MDSDTPKNGLVRLSTILRLIPVGKTTWWAGVKKGRFPKPVKLGPRTTCWYWEDILPFIEKPKDPDAAAAPGEGSEGGGKGSGKRRSIGLFPCH